MESLRGDADLIIDTSGLTPHELRDRIREAFADAPPEHGLQVSLISFGFKYGAPRDADLVLRRPVPARTRTGSRSSGRCPGPTRAVCDVRRRAAAQYARVHASG